MQNVRYAGVFSPGSMGRTLGVSLSKSGFKIIYPGNGRSEKTRESARALGFMDVFTPEEMFSASEVVFCIGTNGLYQVGINEALKFGFKGIYVDANSIHNRDIERQIRETAFNNGIRYVECALRGQPIDEENWGRGRTMFLSGEEADYVATMFRDGVWAINVCANSAKEIVRMIDIPGSGGAIG